MVTVGVLALQGAFAKHCEALRALDVIACEVRTPAELERCDALIIPGGESTTMVRQIAFIGLGDPLRHFAKSKPIFGTCAGLILMSQDVLGGQVEPFGWMSLSVARNAYGSQSDSFTAPLTLNLPGRKSQVVPATFIRAPRIQRYGDGVKVLASFEDAPVLVQQGRCLAAAYHPELSHDLSVHRHFLTL